MVGWVSQSVPILFGAHPSLTLLTWLRLTPCWYLSTGGSHSHLVLDPLGYYWAGWHKSSVLLGDPFSLSDAGGTSSPTSWLTVQKLLGHEAFRCQFERRSRPDSFWSMQSNEDTVCYGQKSGNNFHFFCHILSCTAKKKVNMELKIFWWPKLGPSVCLNCQI